MERTPAPVPDPIRGSLTELVPTVLLALDKDIDDWIKDFQSMERALEMMQGENDPENEAADSPQRIWKDNIGSLVHDVPSALMNWLDSVAHEPATIASAL